MRVDGTLLIVLLPLAAAVLWGELRALAQTLADLAREAQLRWVLSRLAPTHPEVPTLVARLAQLEHKL